LIDIINRVIIHIKNRNHMPINLDSFLQITLPLAALIAWFIKRLDKKFDKIDGRFDRVDNTLKEHGERLAFLEAANIYTMPIEAVVPNARSQAAKERWNRKRLAKVEVKK